MSSYARLTRLDALGSSQAFARERFTWQGVAWVRCLYIGISENVSEKKLPISLTPPELPMDNQTQQRIDEHAKGDPARVVLLRKFNNAWFHRGRPKLVEILWLLLDAALVRSRVPGGTHRRLILRAFGALIGNRVIIKPGVRIKFPWRLEIGDDSWVGEDVWIDNLAPIQIGSNCCISQGVYICTGSHDWGTPTFDLIVKPVRIEDGAWLASRSVIGPGVLVGEGAVLSLGSVATSDLAPWCIYQGVPATLVKQRRVIVAAPS
jgi:putative colanic acid biosynthesis acetyltransferase WcaF